MGALLDRPKTDKYKEKGEGNGLRYGVVAMQGWRIEMEDAHCAVTGIEGPDGVTLQDWSYFAIFDGHAGAGVSENCAKHLLESVMQTEEFKDNVSEGIRTGFLKYDSKLRKSAKVTSGEDHSGSTAVCAFVSPKQMYIANCGDSRAVVSSQGKPIFSTKDHKPDLPNERERIQAAGGSVVLQRVNGNLAVSRALGDFEYKNVTSLGQCEQLVSPEPDVFVLDRNDADYEFMILACDGVWDVMSNEDLCLYVHSRLQLTDDLVSVAGQIIDTCLYRGSRDNMSVVLVTFAGSPTPNPESILREQQLEQTVEQHIKEYVASAQNGGDKERVIIIDELLCSLPHLNVEWPPGVGMCGKRQFIQSVIDDVLTKHRNSSEEEEPNRINGE